MSSPHSQLSRRLPALPEPSIPLRQAETPIVQDLLESLDDAMFAALAGDAAALELAPELWRQAVTLLERELVEESREQYLRYAAEVTWPSQAPAGRVSAAAFAAQELVDLLTRG